MSQCRKCGGELAWMQKRFNGALKWVPTNPDGSDHWDLCREIRNKAMTPAERVAQVKRDEAMCPPFWTIADGKGRRITVYEQPETWGRQPAPIEDLVDWDEFPPTDLDTEFRAVIR